MKSISLINGPNLNLLGTRERQIYGTETLEQIVEKARLKANELGYEVDDYQSNSEGSIIDEIHATINKSVGIIINPGAYSHTSIAIRDALAAFVGPIVEVHISDINEREEFRRFSYISDVSNEVIVGKGTDGYIEAVEVVAKLLEN